MKRSIIHSSQSKIWEELYSDPEHPLRQAIPLLNPMNDAQSVYANELDPRYFAWTAI
jgi:hypothetical protein